MITLTREISVNQLRWRNSVNEWTRQNGILSTSDMYKWRDRLSRDSSTKMFGVLNDEGENVGTVGLSNISLIHGTAEFSILIGPEFQKKGYGKQALIELLKYGFKDLRLCCIYGETFEGNPALKMFLDVGFQQEGLLRSRYFKNGRYINSYSISILWNDAQQQEWW